MKPHKPIRTLPNKHTLTAFLLAFIFFGAIAQKDGEFFEKSLEYKIPFTTTQYSTKNGLIQNQVVDVEAGSDGLLYLSTGNAVYTFNGYDLKEIDIDKNYHRHFFHTLVYNNAYNLLMGYNAKGDLCRILPSLKEVSLPGVEFRPMISPGSGRLYMATRDAEIYEVQLPGFDLKKSAFRLPAPVNALLTVDSLLYAATPKGLFCHNLLTRATKKISDLRFYKLKQEPQSKRLYGISNASLVAIGDTGTVVFSLNLNNVKDRLRDVEFISPGELYITTGKGLYHVSNGQTTLYTTSNGLISNALYNMHYNKQQNCLFVGTADKGLMKLQFKSARTLYKNQGLSESSSGSIIRTQAGKILFNETCCEIHELLNDTIVNYSSVKGYYSVMTEIDGQLLCGTWGSGLRVVTPTGTTAVINKPKLPDSVPHAIFKDRKGAIWIGTAGGIAQGYSLSTLKPVFMESIRSQVNVIYELKSGALCFGGAQGFWLVEDNVIKKHFGENEGLTSNAVRSFYEDAEGKLWIGTYGGGVYCYENDKLTHLNSKKGCCLFEDAFCLAPDAYGNLLMTSNYGLWSIPIKALDDFYKNKTGFLVPAHYTELNGLLNTEFNGGFQNNYLRASKDHFYFPSVEGIVSYTAAPLPYRRMQPEIESVTVNDSAAPARSTAFARNTFLLKFKVSCVNFAACYNVFFQYRLEGYNAGDWSLPQKENTFNFYLLPPGNYKLAVRIINAFNDASPAETIYEFSIAPYFYETLWFKLCVAAAFIISVILIGRYRIRLHKRKAEEKEFYARRIAEIELKAVQAQLNPHFIFNCLNTIKYFILDHDFEKANKGLNHFSKLLRDVLDNSEKFTISLQEEIKFITDYLELEKMRLQGQLDVSITNTIKHSNVLLPAMLIQPHVENAVKHGISNLEHRKGILSISFTQTGNFIACVITDNGIGRTAAARIKKPEAHRSVGLGLTRDKSEILKKIHNIDIVTTITDLYADNGEPTGTQVAIKIPLHHESSPH